MRKEMVLLALMLLGTSYAFAAPIDVNTNVNNNQANAQQGQLQGQLQGQVQGQVQNQAQDASNNGNNTASNNTVNEKSVAYAPLSTQTGSDGVNASSPMFNAGINSTKKYVILNAEYDFLVKAVADGFYTKEEVKPEVEKILATYKKEARRKKLLGLPFTANVCDNSLVNALPVCL